MKKTIIIAAIALMAGMPVFAAEKATMSLADASGKIAEAIDKPETMGEIVSKLSSEDQVAYVAKVNAAIDALNGSPESKAAKYLDANMAAFKAADKKNTANVLAEIFATVPPEALVVINEQFAAKLLNRAADPEKVFTDDQFTNVVITAMDVIQKRNETADDAGVRNTFAILMFVRASNGTPSDLADTLVDRIPDATTRELARNEWIGPALNEGNYEPLLAAADGGAQPEMAIVLRLAKPQMGAAMLADLGAGSGMFSGQTLAITPTSSSPMADADNSSGLNRVPRTMNRNEKYFGGSSRGGEQQQQGEIPLYKGQESGSF